MSDTSALGAWAPKFEDWKAFAMPLFAKGEAKQAFSKYPWFTTEGDPFARLEKPAKQTRFALITTGGFEDVLEIGRQNRAELYDLHLERAPVLVPRELRLGLPERVEFTGVVAGMSGSPVFIDGRLIGAVSYRIGSFAKEPIAGITPIHDMLKLEELEWRTARESGEEILGGMISVLQDPDEGQVGAARQKDLSHRVTSAASSIQPIRTPLVFSGFAPEVLDAVAPFFESRGFQPAMGGGSSDDGASDGADLLQAGSPVAGQMVRGDMGIAATGTVTYREGNRVLAFGHPLLRMGPVKIPMATAKILHTLPSSLGSFKISTPGKIVGQIRQDRLTAILGVIGDLPTTAHVERSADRVLVGERE